MPPPDLAEEHGLLIDLARALHVHAPEDVGKFVNARLHTRKLSGEYERVSKGESPL